MEGWMEREVKGRKRAMTNTKQIYYSCQQKFVKNKNLQTPKLPKKTKTEDLSIDF